MICVSEGVEVETHKLLPIHQTRRMLCLCFAAAVSVSSPLAVDFGGFVAGQSPHVARGQAGRPVGLQCQWGEPVQGHEGEEAGVVHRVLVPGTQKKK